MPRVIAPRDESELRPQEHVEALLFDWDGTLFDNHDVNFLALSRALSSFGVHIDHDWFERNSGYSARRIVTMATERDGLAIDPLSILRVRDEMSEALVGEVVPVDRILALVHRYRGEIAMAVVTGSERSNIQSTLRHFGLESTFGAIVTRDQVEQGKPDPAGYSRALGLLGVEPSRALAFEDSDQGIAAALAAGIDVVDVRYVADWPAATESGSKP